MQFVMPFVIDGLDRTAGYAFAAGVSGEEKTRLPMIIVWPGRGRNMHPCNDGAGVHGLAEGGDPVGTNSFFRKRHVGSRVGAGVELS